MALAEAREYLIPTSRAHYLATQGQFTIMKFDTDSLNEAGRAALAVAQAKVAAGRVKGVLVDAEYHIHRSGPWINDRDHPGATERDWTPPT